MQPLRQGQNIKNTLAKFLGAKDTILRPSRTLTYAEFMSFIKQKARLVGYVAAGHVRQGRHVEVFYNPDGEIEMRINGKERVPREKVSFHNTLASHSLEDRLSNRRKIIEAFKRAEQLRLFSDFEYYAIIRDSRTFAVGVALLRYSGLLSDVGELRDEVDICPKTYHTDRKKANKLAQRLIEAFQK